MTGRIVRGGVFLAVVLTAFSLAFAEEPPMADPSSGADPAWVVANNFGTVTLLYPDRGGVYFKLIGGKTGMQPKDGYYYLPLSHPNYQAMYDLLYRTADKKWRLYVNCDTKLNANGHATANHFAVHFTE